MYDWQTSERVAALKGEIASLRHTDGFYAKKRQHTLNEAVQHNKRIERVQQILAELNDLRERKHPPSW